jgi:hypothetical protein
VDAPVARVEAVLGRSKKLEDIVRNKWVKFFVRDPRTQQIYREDRGRYLPVDRMDDAMIPLPDHVPFTEHEAYCKQVKKQEDFFTVSALGLITVSSLLPLFPDGIQNFDPSMLPEALEAIDPIQATVTAAAALLGASSVAFSRRYLHGEFMYGRMQMVSAGMVLGFNLVAVAPTLEQVFTPPCVSPPPPRDPSVLPPWLSPTLKRLSVSAQHPRVNPGLGPKISFPFRWPSAGCSWNTAPPSPNPLLLPSKFPRPSP